jgi:hypothetical protein
MEAVMAHLAAVPFAATLLCLAGAAGAQEGRSSGQPPTRAAWPYVLIGAGASTCGDASSLSYHGAAGGEFLAAGGFGFGLELAGPAPPDGTCLFGMLSVNALYHFRPRAPIGRWLPFVTGGYTGLAAEGGGSGGNVGAGVMRFFARHFGLRLEVRMHFVPYDDVTELRVGVVF